MVTETHNVDFTAKDKTKAATASVSRNFTKVSSKADGLAGRFRNMARATAAIRGPLDGVAARMSSLGSLLGNVSLGWIAVGTAIAGASVVLKKSIGVFSDYQQSMLGINALIERTGHAAGVTGDQISDMAERIGRDTLASASEVRDAAAIMLTFKSVTGDAFGRSIELAQDMAAVMKQDLNSSVKQLGKVLEDPIRNLSALNRSGVSFTATQTAMIKKMVEMGDKAGAQTAIMDVLAGQLGGFGAAEGQGVAGAIDLVGENWTLLMRKLGETGVAEEAASLMARLAGGMRIFAESIDPTLQEELNNKLREHAEITIRLNRYIKEGFEGSALAAAQKRSVLGCEILAIEEKIQAEKELNQINADQSAMLAELNAENDRDAADRIKREEELQKATEKRHLAQVKAADRFGEMLQKEADQARQASMEKLAIENESFVNKMLQIDMNHEKELITDEEFFAQSELAKQAHEDRKTTIQVENDEKRQKLKDQANSMMTSAGFALANDMVALGQAAAGENEALQKKMFLLSKAVSIAQIIVSTMTAAAKAEVIDPTGVLAARVTAMGYTRAAVVAATSIMEAGARVHGGSVIGNRPYLVGERGPELFTPGSSGNITNNSNTVNNGGATYITNNYIDAIDTKSFDERISESGTAVFNANASQMEEIGASYG